MSLNTFSIGTSPFEVPEAPDIVLNGGKYEPTDLAEELYGRLFGWDIGYSI